ncbi:MAG: winged helix-turn-helix domain-containing protein [Pseudonocardia sp.]|nr:winged helix-turn-helix domain-containing protein [Pseudonocardia sp.]
MADTPTTIPRTEAREGHVRRGDADIAAVGALLADPGRGRILLALDDGRALPASLLAAEAGVAPATASSHLRKLVTAELLTVEKHGRHRYYRLAGPDVGDLVEVLSRLAPAKPVRSLREGTRAHALRAARSCYDHLAGRLGVAVMAAMIERSQLTGGDAAFDPDRAIADKRAGYGRDLNYHLTETGHVFLTDLGVTLPARPVVRYCVDWSEQRHHLSGGVGRALLTRLVELDWLHRTAAHRAINITDTGRDGLRDTFGINTDR